MVDTSPAIKKRISAAVYAYVEQYDSGGGKNNNLFAIFIESTRVFSSD